MILVSAVKLRRLTTRIFQDHGAPEPVARRVADSLVQANLRGHDSHGVLRVSRYLDFIRCGQIVPAARPVVRHQRGSTALVDGGHAFGQAGADFACQVVAELAELQGVGSVALHNVMHIGRLGEYAEQLARRGFAVLVVTSNGGPDNAVAPFGGRDRLFGTNPLAFAVPGPARRAPLVVDFATSATAEGKLAVARTLGQPVEEGALVDARGRPSTLPDDFYAGGALLPFGAHKGYGIMLMVELLARVMTGYVDPAAEKYFRRPGNVTLFTAWSVAEWGAGARFMRETGKLMATVKASRPAEGQTAVLLPGEMEARNLVRRKRTGIPLPEETWSGLQALARG
jgi:LDH2 family malate/lactate/ureidoglycolate dehydrogenase